MDESWLTDLDSKYFASRSRAMENLLDYTNIPRVKEALSEHESQLMRLKKTLIHRRTRLLFRKSTLLANIERRRLEQEEYATLNDDFCQTDYMDTMIIMDLDKSIDELTRKLDVIEKIFAPPTDYDTSVYAQFEELQNRPDGSESAQFRNIEDTGKLIEEIQRQYKSNDAQDEDLELLEEDAYDLFSEL